MNMFFLLGSRPHSHTESAYVAFAFTETGPSKEMQSFRIFGREVHCYYELRLSEGVPVDKVSLPFHPLNHCIATLILDPYIYIRSISAEYQ
jgi:hypothetical protein